MELVSRCVECGLAEPESLASLGGSAPGVVDGILSYIVGGPTPPWLSNIYKIVFMPFHIQEWMVVVVVLVTGMIGMCSKVGCTAFREKTNG